MRYENAYGHISEKTAAVKDLVSKVSRLGKSSSTTVDDVQTILDGISDQMLAYNDVFVDAARDLLSDIVDDGILSDDERSALSAFSDIYNNPISEDPVVNVEGKRFVLTGDFETTGGKSTIKEMIEAAGGKTTGSVSGKTDYVVAGACGSDAWAYGGYGGKIKDALDLRLQRKASVLVVSESALMAYFEEEHPESMAVLNERQERYSHQWESARVVSQSFSGLTKGQQKAFNAIKAGRNLYLAGLGGTGKSYLLNKVIDWAQNQEMNVVVCAPTGIAAINIGGSTIHRALGIRPESTLKRPFEPWVEYGDALYECDLMIVDEISMCRLDLFDYLSSALEKAAKLRKADGRNRCQLIVVGDFSQLPPVVTKEDRKILEEQYGYRIEEGYAFMGETWNTWNFEKVELTEAIRQRDSLFVAALNACRIGDTSGVRWIEDHAAPNVSADAIRLCGTNAKSDEINSKKLHELNTPECYYNAEIEGDIQSSDYPTATRLELRKGARVMILTNHPGGRYMNGTLGTIAWCDSDSVRVMTDNGSSVTLEPHCFEIRKPVAKGRKTTTEVVGTFTQLPLKLAYALTIHKAQGQTFDEAVIYPDCWDPGQLYTALSRLTSIDGLCLAHHCPDSSLVASKAVIDFYEGKAITKQPLATSNSSERPHSANDLQCNSSRNPLAGDSKAMNSGNSIVAPNQHTPTDSAKKDEAEGLHLIERSFCPEGQDSLAIDLLEKVLADTKVNFSKLKIVRKCDAYTTIVIKGKNHDWDLVRFKFSARTKWISIFLSDSDRDLYRNSELFSAQKKKTQIFWKSKMESIEELTNYRDLIVNAYLECVGRDGENFL